MAPLLSRLFSNRKHSAKSKFTDDCKEYESHKISKFDSEKQIRLLLYRDCQWKGRKLLFDSKTIRRKELPPQVPRSSPSRLSPLNLRWNAGNKQLLSSPTKQNRKSEISDEGIMYEYLQPSPDTTMLGEMILGSVALSDQSSMKVHTIRFPSQLMLSMVFPAPVRERNEEKPMTAANTLHNSTSEINIKKKIEKTELSFSNSVPVSASGGMPFMSSSTSNLNMTESLHLNTSTTSLQSHEGCTLKHSSSYNNLHRRRMRNLATSLDCGIHFTSTMPSVLENVSSKQKINLGLSIVVGLDKLEEEESQFQDFFFSHITLIESHMHKLKEVVTDAYLQGRNFVEKIYKGLKQIRKVMQDLYTAPRLHSPMWLVMMTAISDHQEKSSQLVEEFVALLEEFDIKGTNFFVSTLLTAILTYHLSWVSTVIPTNILCYHECHQRNKTKWIDQVAKIHSYNPLWMQLGDINGSTGFPPKLTRIIVTGKKISVIYRFLFVFSYFIRCGDVYEKELEVDSLSLEDCFVGNDKDERSLRTKSSSVAELLFKNQRKESELISSDKIDPVDAALIHCASCERHNCQYICRNSESVKTDCIKNYPSNAAVCYKLCSEENERLFNSDCRKQNSNDHKIIESLKKETPVIDEDDIKLEKILRTTCRNEEELTKIKLLYLNKFANSKCGRTSDNVLTDQIDSSDLDNTLKQIQHVMFFIGENPEIDQQIWNNFATKEERLTLHNLLSQAKNFPSDTYQGKSYERFNDPNMFKSKLSQLIPSLHSKFSSNELCNCETVLDKECRAVHNIPIVKIDNTEITQKSPSAVATKHKTEQIDTYSDLFVNNSLFTVNEIEENNCNDLSEGDGQETKSSSDKCKLQSSSPFCSDEKNFRHIDNSKLYIQEYHNLRFAPERCSAFIDMSKQNYIKNIETNCDNITRDNRSESPEEGYHSMEDTKCNQTEIHFNDVSSPTVSEIPLLRTKEKEKMGNNSSKNLGWSLMAGITKHFMSCFSLQGIHENYNDQTAYKKLRNEIVEDLVTSYKFSFPGEDISEAVCILADTDHWKVQLLSSDPEHNEKNDAHITMSSLISGICESLVQMVLLNLPPEYCLMYLENQLQELYFKSQLLTEYLNNTPSLGLENAIKSLKLDPSDLPLLLAIGSGSMISVS